MISGGNISAFEYRLAVAFGAKAAVIEDSVGEAPGLIQFHELMVTKKGNKNKIIILQKTIEQIRNFLS